MLLIGLLFTITSASLIDVYDSTTCGRPVKPPLRNTSVFNYKIIGGRPVKPNKVPWSVMIEIFPMPGQKMKNLCTGTLITSRHVLTAAHCFIDHDSFDPSGCSQMLGSQVVQRTVVTFGGVKFNGSSITRKTKGIKLSDPFFAGECSKGLDIALLELDEPVPEEVHHACLPIKEHRVKLCTPRLRAAGYGKNFDDHYPDNKLLQLDLGYATPHHKCASTFPRESKDAICFNEKKMKNLCMGDSGAGITTTVSAQTVLLGIMSFGTSCESVLDNLTEPSLALNTDVRHHMKDILEIIEDSDNDNDNEKDF